MLAITECVCLSEFVFVHISSTVVVQVFPLPAVFSFNAVCRLEDIFVIYPFFVPRRVKRPSNTYPFIPKPASDVMISSIVASLLNVIV